MRPRVIHALRRLDAIAVENPACPGTQDVNFAEGWVELKWLREWPKRADTIVEIDHFTPQQRIRQMRRSRAKGNTWLLLQVRQEWLLFDGEVARLHVGKATRAQLIELAHRYWPAGLDDDELEQTVKHLRTRR
jgi:hypothetical protein